MKKEGKAPLASMMAFAMTLALAGATPAHARGADNDEAVKSLPPEAQEAVQGIAQSLMQVQDTQAELSCDKAVENARYGLETMLEVGQKNADGGYIKRSDFESMATRLRESLAQVTPQDCASATGEKQAFYRCMSSDYNHVTACAAAHRF
jgi:hypothetical protein